METYLLLQQYSSNLTEYRKDTFGGFYPVEVHYEIGRGKYLVRVYVGTYTYGVGSTVDTSVVRPYSSITSLQKGATYQNIDLTIVLLKLQNLQL